MENIKDPYFILSLIFGGLSVIFWLSLFPFFGFLVTHIYTKHVKEKLIEQQKLQQITNRLDIVERRVSFSK